MNKRNVLITGGSRGIGFALAALFIENGDQVSICSKNMDSLAAAKNKLPAVNTIQADLQTQLGRQTLIDQVKEIELDLLINNAGLMKEVDCQHADVNALHAEMDVNFFAPVELIHGLLPYLLKRPSAVIVNVSSALIYMPMAVTPFYSASKYALHAYTKSLRHQLKDTPVRVLEAIPPGVDTDMTRDYKYPKLSAKKAAEIIYDGIAKNKPEIKVGFAKTMSLLSRLFPKFLFKMMHGKKIS